jgi:hypothetical protein
MPNDVVTMDLPPVSNPIEVMPHMLPSGASQKGDDEGERMVAVKNCLSLSMYP